jgi:peptide chain release factor 2
MLWRMYTRWSEEHGYSVRVLSITPGEEAGIKSLTALIKGKYAFGHLKAERGIHRLVRLSPFDANKRRHTSFTSVDVVPELSEDIEVEINDKDLRVDTYHSSGAGGQHVNVTDSAVRMTHLPTGIVVQCQNERSQHKNRAMALKVLKARIYQRELEERKKKMAEHYDAQKDIAWGSQIRSYVFQPYTMVKDHRTGHTVGNIKKVMDGGIDLFILEYLRWRGRS